jgi:hypothetical protein
VAARLPGPRATALRAGEDRRRCDIELPRAGEGCVGEKLSATSAGSSPRDRSIARRRAMIRFGFSSAPALSRTEAGLLHRCAPFVLQARGSIPGAFNRWNAIGMAGARQ